MKWINFGTEDEPDYVSPEDVRRVRKEIAPPAGSKKKKRQTILQLFGGDNECIFTDLSPKQAIEKLNPPEEKADAKDYEDALTEAYAKGFETCKKRASAISEKSGAHMDATEIRDMKPEE